jgi:hypothetical protein
MLCIPIHRDRSFRDDDQRFRAWWSLISDMVIAHSGIMIADSGVIAWTPGRPTHR